MSGAVANVWDEAALVRLLQRCQLDLSTEKRLQVDVAAVFAREGVPHEREKRLNEHDIPDFLVDGGIVVECKMRGRARKVDIYRQLERYASSDQVRSIILAANLVMGLPAEILGKPVYVASLSRGWV